MLLMNEAARAALRQRTRQRAEHRLLSAGHGGRARALATNTLDYASMLGRFSLPTTILSGIAFLLSRAYARNSGAAGTLTYALAAFMVFVFVVHPLWSGWSLARHQAGLFPESHP